MKQTRNKKGQFIEGNNAAEKWTEKTVCQTLVQIWETLTKGYEVTDGNFVRANDIKTLAEVCLMHNVGKQRWSEWKKKFENSDSVSELIKKIEWVIETRLVYSGGTMDIFVLKNHYDYKDRIDTDITTKGERINNGIDLSKYLSFEQLAEIKEKIDEGK